MYDANLRLRFNETLAAGDSAGVDPLLALLLRRNGHAPFRIRTADMVVEADDRFFSLLRRPAGSPAGFSAVVADFEPEVASALAALVMKAIEKRGGLSARHRHRLPDGTVRLLEWEATSAGPADGVAEHIVGVLRDVTDETEAANLLDGQKELIANLVDALPLPVAILTNRLHYLAVNRRWIEDFAVDAADGLVGRRHYDVFPDTPVRWRELHHLALNGDRVTCDHDEVVRADGARLLVNWVLQPWRDKTGGIGGVVVMAEILRLAPRFDNRPERGDLARILFDPGGGPRSEGGARLPKNPWLRAVAPNPPEKSP